MPSDFRCPAMCMAQRTQSALCSERALTLGMRSTALRSSTKRSRFDWRYVVSASMGRAPESRIGAALNGPRTLAQPAWFHAGAARVTDDDDPPALDPAR